MKPQQFNQPVERQEAAVEPYVAPAIEVIDIELQQNILEGSGFTLPSDPDDGGDL
ncbi:MAG TPA: hypothetical protein GXZ56_11930 [Bacteroidales bacterium]|jgi:hypothetical protein|nr:hypothetical protein [Bacteroidales bacterium]